MAYNEELGKILDINDLEEIKKYSWICNGCKENLIPIHKYHKPSIDIFVSSHFKHKSKSNCESEPETAEHIFMKRYFEYNLPNYNKIKLIRKEERIELENRYRIADIYLELETGEKIAIEVQHSPISEEDLIKRTQDYNSQNIYVMWVINNFSTGYKEYDMWTHFGKAYHIFISPRHRFEPDEKTDVWFTSNHRDTPPYPIISDLKIQCRERNGFKCAEFPNFVERELREIEDGKDYENEKDYEDETDYEDEKLYDDLLKAQIKNGVPKKIIKYYESYFKDLIKNDKEKFKDLIKKSRELKRIIRKEI